ncbi:DUF2971 domain-containing protein [Kluyvera georgiana]|uniref:DUF2971 domain-containing protein n=1 Tax=Kluyvera georgiana TaxID=73098 RepID=UPI003D95BA38
MYLSSDTHLFRFRADNENTVNELINNVIWHSKARWLNDPFEMFFNFDPRDVSKLSRDDVATIIKKSNFLKENRVNIERCFLSNDLSPIYKFLNDMLGKKTVTSLVEDLQRNIVVACFTKAHDSRLMWGYYGNGMQGVCFAYNKEKLVESGIEFDDVDYVETAPTIDIYKHLLEQVRGLPSTINSRFSLTKHNDWKKEEEVRSLKYVSSEDMSESAHGYAVQLNNRCIDAVIIGDRLTGEIRDSIAKYARENGIELLVARADLSNYKIQISAEK